MTWQDWIILGLGVLFLGPFALAGIVMVLGTVLSAGEHMAGGFFGGISQKRRLNRMLKQMQSE